MPAFLIGVGVLFYGVAVDFALEGYERVLRRQRLEGRPRYSSQTIYSLYYAESGVAQDRITRAWNEAANILQVDGDRVRPEDRLSGTLGFARKFRAIHSDVNVLVDTVNAHLYRHGKPAVRGLETFHDVVWQLAALGDSPAAIEGEWRLRRMLNGW